MKTIVNIFFTIIICLFGVINVFAEPSPPSPGARKPPPPPGLPIDDGLYILFILGLLYGIYIIYGRHLNNKTPI
ncbi:MULTISPECIES: hypothetical protein [unclassified Flavobacterium]|jgi:hypothetical protein|uniref:hypothetical protein n=1 Tax=unclassified Flavobacterium TaxID=196869 RepID=UPI0025BB7600|nr:MULTISPECIES: hypothetical protein [unclassified Flavobacterium]